MTQILTPATGRNHGLARLSEHDGVPVLWFRSRLPGRPPTQDTILRFFASGFTRTTATVSNLIVDLDGVALLDSTALSSLIAKREQLASIGGRLALCGISSPRLREILHITCIDQILLLAADRGEAAGLIRQRD